MTSRRKPSVSQQTATKYVKMAIQASWELEKYARYVLTKKGSTSGEWKYYSDKPGQRLVMTLTDTGHLVICHESCVLESHSLVTARAWMRGLGKTDSLLIMYKHKESTRRFRVKFRAHGIQTGSTVCAQTSATLSKFFPVKIIAEYVTPSWSGGSTDSKSQRQGQPGLSGEVTLGIIARSLTGKGEDVLPAAYKAHPKASDVVGMKPIPDDVISRYLRIFLADPSFPALVEQVDKQLQAIIRESRE